MICSVLCLYDDGITSCSLELVVTDVLACSFLSSFLAFCHLFLSFFLPFLLFSLFLHEICFEYHIDLCNESCSSGQPASCPAVLHDKYLNVGHQMQTVQLNFVIPAMLIGTIDFYHCILLSLTLTLSGVHRVTAKKKPIGVIFLHTFHLIRTTFDVVMGLLRSKIFKTREITAVLQAAPKKSFNIGMHSGSYEWVWFKLGIMIDTVVLYLLILVLLTLTVIRGHRSVRKQKLLHQLSHKVVSWLEWNLIYYWDLVWQTSYSSYLVHKIFKGKNPTFMISFKKNFNIGLYSDIYTPISFKLSVMIETTYLLMPIAPGGA